MPRAARPLAGCRILLVEDEYLIADVMEEWLREAGAEVVGPVPSAAQAFELIDIHVDVLDGAVLDVNLGCGETVYPVAERLNEVGVPYLFATGEVQILGDPMNWRRPRLDKPISRHDLLKAVRDLLNGDEAG